MVLDVITVKVHEKLLHPFVHDAMVLPSPDELPQEKLVVPVPEGGQHLKRTDPDPNTAKRACHRKCQRADDHAHAGAITGERFRSGGRGSCSVDSTAAWVGAVGTWPSPC